MELIEEVKEHVDIKLRKNILQVDSLFALFTQTITALNYNLCVYLPISSSTGRIWFKVNLKQNRVRLNSEIFPLSERRLLYNLSVTGDRTDGFIAFSRALARD